MEDTVASWTTKDVKIWLEKNNLQKFGHFVDTYEINGKSLLVYDVHMLNVLKSHDAVGTPLLPPALITTSEGKDIGWGENMEFLYHANKLRQSIEESKELQKSSPKRVAKRVGVLVIKNLVKQVLKLLIKELIKQMT